MSTPYTTNIKTEFGKKDPDTPEDIRFTTVNKEEESASSDGDSSDDELPTFVTGKQKEKNTPVVKVNLGEQEQELEVEVNKDLNTSVDNEEASLSSDKTDETASSKLSISGISVPESSRESSRGEIDDSEKTGNVNEGPSFGIRDSSEDDVSSIDMNLSESDKTDAPGEQNVTPAQQNIIVAEREVTAAQDDIRRDIEENTYIRTHINGVLDGDDDVLFMKLTSPDKDATTIFYEERYNTNDTDQKELIPFIFLFAKTYKKIDDSVKAINSLLQEDNKNNEINSQLTTLQGQLQMFYELPLQHKDGEQLISNPDYYFGENQPSVIIFEGKPQIFFQTTDEQKDWEDFMKYFNENVSASYKKGKVQFEPNAKKSVKQFKEKYLTKKSSSIMSRMGSMFGSRQGGNKKQTRRPVMHKKRQTRRK